MTTYFCHICNDVHDRWTRISMLGSLCFDNRIFDSPEPCYGCPQCAKNCCAVCAHERNEICVCGGELVPEMMYFYSGENRLPPEIAVHQTFEARMQALEDLRTKRHMIQAEYDSHKYLIDWTAKYQKPGEPMLSGFGTETIEKRAKLYQKGIITWMELYVIVWQDVLPETADDVMCIIDKYVKDFSMLERELERYPNNEDGWINKLEDYRMSRMLWECHVPVVTPEILRDRDRFVVETIRDGLERWKERHPEVE